MKNYLLIAGLTLITTLQATAQDSIAFTIRATVPASRNEDPVVMMAGFSKVKTTKVKDGAFTLSGYLKEPGMMLISMGNGVPTDHIKIYVTGGDVNIHIKDSLKFAQVTGNEQTSQYQQLNKQLVPLVYEDGSLMRRWNVIPAESRREEEGRAIYARRKVIADQTKELTYAFIRKHPKSPLSLFLLEQTAGSFVNYDEVMPKFKQLDKSLQASPEGKDFEKKIITFSQMRPGMKAKDFEAPAPDGKTLALEDIVKQSKITMVDFWASWCIPCRAENPNVVKAYNAYHDKGLNIISVSLDENGDKWKAAIEKDGMPWHHVSNLKGFKDPIAYMYGITVIPQNALIDEKGNILAVNLKGDALLNKLEELFPKN